MGAGAPISATATTYMTFICAPTGASWRSTCQRGDDPGVQQAIVHSCTHAGWTRCLQHVARGAVGGSQTDQSSGRETRTVVPAPAGL